MVPDGHLVSGPDNFSAIKEAKILSMGPKCGKEHISVLGIGGIFQQRRKIEHSADRSFIFRFESF